MSFFNFNFKLYQGIYVSCFKKKTEHLHVLLCTLFLSDFIEHIIILDCSISNMDINLSYIVCLSIFYLVVWNHGCQQWQGKKKP